MSAGDPETVAAAIDLVLNSPRAAATISKLGIEEAATFSWADAAARSLAAIRGTC